MQVEGGENENKSSIFFVAVWRTDLDWTPEGIRVDGLPQFTAKLCLSPSRTFGWIGAVW